MYSMFSPIPNFYTPPLNTPSQQIQYVDGLQGAESYQLPPNSGVVLMDSNNSTFYVKKTDASGTVTMKTYKGVEKEKEKPIEYVTKAEFEKFKSTVKGVKHEPNNEGKTASNGNAT